MSTTGHLRPDISTRPRSALTTAAVSALLIVVASACSGVDTTAATTTSEVNAAPTTSTAPDESSAATSADPTTTSPSSPDVGGAVAPTGEPVDADRQEIIDRYNAYWDARFAANAGTPDPQYPALVEYATGSQLEAVIAETQANLDDGRAFQKSANPANYKRVTVVSVDGDEAEVQECVVDDVMVIARDTGAVINDTVVTHSVRGELRRVDGVWRVSTTSLVQRWEGVAGCALAS